MTADTALALIGFAFVMSISPGPGNFLLLASGATFGFARSLPLVLGISAGFLGMVFAVGMGLGSLLARAPEIDIVLRIACGLYVLWLAVRIARSRALASGGETVSRPIGFVQAALFQLVNPKAWAVALVVTVSYTDPERLTASLLAMIAVFALVNFPSISLWALSGAGLQRILAKGRRIVVFNVAMAALLVASMVPALLR